MIKKYSKGILAMCLALSLAGCGAKEPATVEEYGNGTAGVTSSSSEITEAEGAGSVSDVEKIDSGAVSEGSLSEKLGGTEHKWDASFTANGIDVNVSAEVQVGDTEQLPSYKISKISEEDQSEDEIVKNLLGDSAQKMDRKLSGADGDSVELINAVLRTYISYNHDEYDKLSYEEQWELDEVPGWVDSENYYIHTYEGTYEGMDYQLYVGYDHMSNMRSIAFFPKNLGEYLGNPNLDYIMSYWVGDDLAEQPGVKDFLDKNKLQGDGKELCRDAENFFKEKLGLKIPDNYLNPHSDMGSNEAQYTFYVNKKAMDDASGGKKEWDIENVYDLIDIFGKMDESDYALNGYMTLPQFAMGNLYIFSNPRKEEVRGYSGGEAYITDKGLLGFSIEFDTNFDEKLSDNVPVLSYDNLIGAFESEMSAKLDATKCNSNSLNFTYAEFCYYFVDSPDTPGESTLVPAWVFWDEPHDMYVIINAMDGSLIEILY